MTKSVLKAAALPLALLVTLTMAPVASVWASHGVKCSAVPVVQANGTIASYTVICRKSGV